MPLLELVAKLRANWDFDFGSNPPNQVITQHWFKQVLDPPEKTFSYLPDIHMYVFQQM